MSDLRLNRKLVLEAQQKVVDGAGGFSETWVALGTLWASITARGGREKARQFVTVSSVPYQIVVRAAPVGAPSRPLPNQRFREGSRTFRILAVSDYDARAKYLLCSTIEEVAA